MLSRSVGQIQQEKKTQYLTGRLIPNSLAPALTATPLSPLVLPVWVLQALGTALRRHTNPHRKGKWEGKCELELG